MKRNQTHLFIAISSIALLIVLILQFNWIIETAKAKEELFNEKANMVLSKTANALVEDKQTCGKIYKGENETHKVDSLFNYFMKLYNVSIAYKVEVKPNTENNNVEHKIYQPNSYQMCMNDGISKNGLELKLVFPDKKQFVRAEMGTLFITSITLILIVLVLYWQTILSLLKEKQISEHTTEFLNNMTHEFKTPITNIALASKMIMKDSTIQQKEKIKHYSEIIFEENEKLQLQVEQVLSMSALEKGEIPLQKTELDFHQLINYSLKCMNIQVENKKGNVKQNLDAEKFVVMGDFIHLSNALCNLIDNALKYSKEKPELHIQTNNINQHLIIMISDKGIGIEKKYEQKVFDKFFRVPTGDVHDVKGFGLGLAYIKKIIELHSGTIELHSKIGEGTVFTITLPYA